jgi:hypothetical protein
MTQNNTTNPHLFLDDLHPSSCSFLRALRRGGEMKKRLLGPGNGLMLETLYAQVA